MKKLDQKFKDVTNASFEGPVPSEFQWENMDIKTIQPKKKNRLLLWLSGAGMIVVGIVVVSMYLLDTKKNIEISDKTVSSEIKVNTNKKIETIDSEEKNIQFEKTLTKELKDNSNITEMNKKQHDKAIENKKEINLSSSSSLLAADSATQNETKVAAGSELKTSVPNSVLNGASLTSVNTNNAELGLLMTNDESEVQEPFANKTSNEYSSSTYLKNEKEYFISEKLSKIEYLETSNPLSILSLNTSLNTPIHDFNFVEINVIKYSKSYLSILFGANYFTQDFKGSEEWERAMDEGLNSEVGSWFAIEYGVSLSDKFDLNAGVQLADHHSIFRGQTLSSIDTLDSFNVLSQSYQYNYTNKVQNNHRYWTSVNVGLDYYLLRKSSLELSVGFLLSPAVTLYSSGTRFSSDLKFEPAKNENGQFSLRSGIKIQGLHALSKKTSLVLNITYLQSLSNSQENQILINPSVIDVGIGLRKYF